MLPSLDEALARRAPLGPLALRLGLGAVFLALAYAVFAAELAAGLALVAGWRVRAVALALVPVMLGALKPHLPQGWMFNAPGGGGWEYVAFLLVALVAQALLGAGAYALDSAAPGRRPPASREGAGA